MIKVKSPVLDTALLTRIGLMPRSIYCPEAFYIINTPVISFSTVYTVYVSSVTRHRQ